MSEDDDSGFTHGFSSTPISPKGSRRKENQEDCVTIFPGPWFDGVAVVRSLIRAAYRFRDAALIDEKKDFFGSALQNLCRALEQVENVVGPS
jgi:hypothetical protein